MKKRLHWLLKIIFFCLIVEIAIRFLGFLFLNETYNHNYRRLFNHSDTIAERLNIVCLGESSTAGLGVDWQDSYPRQLESKLREFYCNDNINVIVPVHVGQNTSQVSNRIKQYVSQYNPRLIIVMVGCNNTWSFAESHITRFLNNTNKEALKVKVLLTLDNFRLFKVLRYTYLRFIAKIKSISIKRYVSFILGHPESVYKRTQIWSDPFTDLNKKAFVELWKYDVRKIIQEAKRNNVKVLLMTYHINPIKYLSMGDFISMANEQEVLLVRNDKPFDLLIKNGTVNNFLLYDDWHPNKHWHPNKRGYSIIANNAFKQIKDNNLLELREL